MAGKHKSTSGPEQGSRVRSRASSPSSFSARAAPTISAPTTPRSGKRKYKLLDLDGTVLNHAGTANDADVAAVRKLSARGIIVTILTGRLYAGTREAAELLGIDGPVGCADGSHIVNVKNDKTLLHHGIRGAAAEHLRASLVKNELATFLFAEEAIVHDERCADFLPYVRTWSTDLRFVPRVTDHALWTSGTGMTATVAIGTEASIGAALAEVQASTADALQISTFPFRNNPLRWGMVARAAGGTKGTALAWMSEHYGIDISETVCVGDWHNDLPMMSCAGRSFAMAQAPSEVKAAATDVLDRTIDAGGAIAEAIQRAFGRS